MLAVDPLVLAVDPVVVVPGSGMILPGKHPFVLKTPGEEPEGGVISWPHWGANVDIGSAMYAGMLLPVASLRRPGIVLIQQFAKIPSSHLQSRHGQAACIGENVSQPLLSQYPTEIESITEIGAERNESGSTAAGRKRLPYGVSFGSSRSRPLVSCAKPST